MDFLDPKKKRAHTIRLMVGYGLIGVALTISSLVLVFSASGYGIDRKTGAVIQNAMLFLSAKPESATMYIDGQNKGATDGRFLLAEGKHSVELRRDGYRTWKRDLTLDGSTVERLTYPFLFPVKPVSTELRQMDAKPDVASASPDRHWLVVHEAAVPQSFVVFDTSKKDGAPTTIETPQTVLPSRPNQTLRVVEWSTDNRHLLLQVTYDGGTDFVILDRQTPQNSFSVTTLLGRSFTQVRLRDKRTDQLYVYDQGGGVLQVADTSSKSLQVVEARVLAFWPYAADTVLYAMDDSPAPGRVSVKIEQNGTAYSLRTLPSGSAFILNMAEFAGHQYVVAGSAAESQAYVYRDPLSVLRKGSSQAPAILTLLRVTQAASAVTFSDSARYVAVQGGASFAVYDIESNRQYRYDIEAKVADGERATWMDGDRLTVLAADGAVRIFDFDGANVQSLVSGASGFTAMFDRDYTALFTVSPSIQAADKIAVLRTELLVKK